MIDEELLREAIRILSERGSRNMSVQDAIDLLASYPSFEDMDDEDLEPIAATALARCAREPQPSPRPTSSGAARAGRPASTRPAPDASMLTAPYRFVTIDDQVVLAPDEVKKACWGFPLVNGYSGAIDVEWAFETPMLIGVADEKGVSGPMKLGDDYIIPGASLRGAMRAAMGIVTRARLAQVNKNHRYGVRDFTHPLFKQGEDGKTRFDWNKLKAGWLRPARSGDPKQCVGDSDYIIEPCDKRLIRIRSLPGRLNRRGFKSGEWHLFWLTTKLQEKYRLAGYVKAEINGKVILDFGSSTKRGYVRDATGVGTFDPMRDDYVCEAANSNTKPLTGWLVFSDRLGTIKRLENLSIPEKEAITHKLNEQDTAQPAKPGFYKKREYVFIETQNPESVRLKQDKYDEFERINSVPGKSKLVPDGSFAELALTLKDGGRIPIFYVGDLRTQDKHFAMGLTRLFKVPHANSVDDVILRQPNHKLDVGNPDMVEALFGYVYDDHDLGRDAKTDDHDAPSEIARKGRVSFGFARLSQETPARETSVVATIAMAPRASYAPFYLRGPIKDWTDESSLIPNLNGEARLAGRKRYFPRFTADARARAESAILETLRRRDNPDATDSRSQLRLLAPKQKGGELVFRGTVRLHNVLAEEIGALLWTLTHRGDASKRHMIGRAKNAGAGQARATIVAIRLTRNVENPADKFVTSGTDEGVS